MKRKVTLKQIAKELDVSISTVSKALKNSSEISDDTKQKVQAFAKLYNYKPNNIALSLKNRRTNTIGIIIPEIVHHFFSKVIRGAELVANRRGYTIIIGLSNESFSREVANMEMLASGTIDGFLLSLSKETLQQQDYYHIRDIIDQDIPIVMFDRTVDSINCDKVIVNDIEGAKHAVEKLITNGCTSIALLTTKDYVSVGHLRTQGYLEALKQHQRAVDSNLILKLDDTADYEDNLEILETELKTLFLSNPNIDGVFAVNEIYALSAMKVVSDLGYNVPNDIQVIGFTDGVLSKHATPSLSTVSQHAQLMGEKAATLLIDRLEGQLKDDAYTTEVIISELIERKSTK